MSDRIQSVSGSIQASYRIQSVSGSVQVRSWDGRKISEPGIYDIPIDIYHGDCCEGPSISSSGLRKIRTHSPLHYWHTSPLNPNRSDDDDESEKEAIRIGRAAHTLMLEPELFKSMFITRPAEFNSWRTKAAKEWRDVHQDVGYTVMNPDEMQRVAGIARALKEHPLIKQGLLAGHIERALIWEDPKTGIWLKSRPDAIPVGSNILADLKCVRDARTDPFSRAAFEAGYDMQMALAGIGMRTILGREIEEYVLVPVESKEPHAIRIAPIAPEEIDRAMLLLRWSINKFADCWRRGEWTFSEDDNTHIYRSDWAIKYIEKQAERGLLPREF